jgi:hypothetical protein
LAPAAALALFVEQRQIPSESIEFPTFASFCKLLHHQQAIGIFGRAFFGKGSFADLISFSASCFQHFA